VGWNEGLGTLNSSVGITFSLNLVAIWALDMVGEPRLLLFFLQNILGLEAVVGREL
jgi:hypothetical protein